jgi:hypothetical protein
MWAKGFNKSLNFKGKMIVYLSFISFLDIKCNNLLFQPLCQYKIIVWPKFRD